MTSGTASGDFRDAAAVDAPLHAAVSRRDLSEISRLLFAGSDINSRDENGQTPLMVAVIARDQDFMRRLISAGADPELPFKNSTDTARSIAGNPGTELRDALDLMHSDYFTKKMLDAIRDNDADEVRRIIDAKVILDLNRSPSDGGYTPVGRAVSEGRPACLEALLEAGASPNLETGNKPPLLSAICSGYHEAETPRLLLKYGADPDAGNGEMLPLVEAARKGMETTLLLLLEAGADPDLPAPRGNEPALVHAVREGHDGIVRALAEHGANLDLRNAGETTPLETALMNRRNDIFATLLELGANPRLASDDGLTSLMKASWSGNAAALPRLVAAGVDIDAQGSEQQMTALMYAGFCGKTEVVRQLLALGADCSLVSKDGKTALDYAQENGHERSTAVIAEKMSEDLRNIAASASAGKAFRLVLEPRKP